MDSYRKHNLITLFVAIFCFSLSAAIIFTSQTAKIEQRKTKGNQVINSVTNNIIITLNRYLTVTEFWNSLIQNDNNSINNFNEISKVIYRNNQALNSIFLAKDGIVSHIYPEMRTQFSGLDLNSSPITKSGIAAAAAIRKATITGPITLTDGKSGMIITQPVYIENNDKLDLWGYSCASLKDKEFFSFVNIDQLINADFEFKLWDNEINPNRRVLIAQSSPYELTNPVEYHFTVVNKTWILSYEPKHGWINPVGLTCQIIFALIMSLSLIQLTHLWFRLRECNYYSSDRVYKDSLTQLFNARKFNIELEKLQKQSCSYGVICIDVNDFKHISDSFGHDQGNELIKVCAKKIMSCIKESDHAYRIGGNQFAVVIHGNNDSENYEPICRRISESLERETTIGTTKIKPAVSIGLASFPKDGINFEDIVSEAEKAMYLNKYRKDKTE